MPQTRFVMRKALDLELLSLVVINKIDRGDARPAEVHDEVLELFMDLEATERQLDSPFLYAVGRDGWAGDTPELSEGDLRPLFDGIISHFPEPEVDPTGPFQMLISTLDHSSYLGRIAIGRIERGQVCVGQRVALLDFGSPGMVDDVTEAEEAKVATLCTFSGLERIEVEEVNAGDIVALTGIEGVEIGNTLSDPEHQERLLGIAVEEPTLSMDFTVNNSPFAGQSGKFVTSRHLRERLYRELEQNVALRVEDTEQPETLTVSGRGELHLSILIETMRREGYEFQVSRPRVITRTGIDGEVQEPYEEALIEVPSEIVGTVIEKLGSRKGEMTDLRPMGDSGTTRLSLRVPARGLVGYRSEFLTDTRGEGVLHHQFHSWGPWAGVLKGRGRGVLVADRVGRAVGFALQNLQERGTLFVSPGEEAYGGMIVGENARPGDLDVNVGKEKKLTNMRAAGSDESIKLEPPRRMTLEVALEFIEDDELIEITPDAVRLRKTVLDQNMRKKAAKRAKG
jgi:GTP-binding protein